MAEAVGDRAGTPPLTGAAPRLWTPTFTLLLAAALLGYGSIYLLVPVIPRYVERLGGTHSDQGLAIGLFSITALAMRPVSGWLSDRFGSRVALMLGIGGMGLVGIAYLPAETLRGALAVRSLHGIGWGLFSVAGSTMAVSVAPPNRRGEALSLFGMMGGLGLAVGPLIGDAVGTDRDAFLLTAAAGATALTFTLIMPRAAPAARDLGSAGVTLFSRGALLPASVVLTYMSTYGAAFAFVPVLTVQRNLGGAGWFFTPYALAMVAARTVTGRLSDRRGRAAVIGPGMILAACALILLGASWSRVALAGAALLYAGAMATVQPVCLAWATDRSRAGERGAAVATVVAAQDLGISTGAFAAGLIADLAGLGFVFMGAAVLALGGFALVAAAARREPMSPGLHNHELGRVGATKTAQRSGGGE